MPLSALVLWVLLRPPAIAFGLGAAFVAYRLARPRAEEHLNELLVEAWRLYALATGVPAFLFGALFGLWAVLFAYRAPFALTGLVELAGVATLAQAPVPLIGAWVAGTPVPRRGRLVAVGLLAAGLVLWGGGRAARLAGWRALEQAAPAAPGALAEVVLLKAYRFVTPASARAALDVALPRGADVLALVDVGRAGTELTFDLDLRHYLAGRLEADLAALPPGDPSSPGTAAVPAIWWLMADAARTLQAYALATPALRPSAARGTPAVQPIVAHALAGAPAPVAGSVLEASDALLSGQPLEPALVVALAARARADDPLATKILLRDASVEALRPILPRFVGAAGPAWQVLRTDCPQRTSGLVHLSADADPEVAAGARAVLGYVRQYCVTTRRTGG